MPSAKRIERNRDYGVFKHILFFPFRPANDMAYWSNCLWYWPAS